MVAAQPVWAHEEAAAAGGRRFWWRWSLLLLSLVAAQMAQTRESAAANTRPRSRQAQTVQEEQAELEERAALAEALMRKLAQAATLHSLVAERRLLPWSVAQQKKNWTSVNWQSSEPFLTKLRLPVQIKQETKCVSQGGPLVIAQNAKEQMTHDRNGEQRSRKKVQRVVCRNNTAPSSIAVIFTAARAHFDKQSKPSTANDYER